MALFSLHSVDSKFNCLIDLINNIRLSQTSTFRYRLVLSRGYVSKFRFKPTTAFQDGVYYKPLHETLEKRMENMGSVPHDSHILRGRVDALTVLNRTLEHVCELHFRTLL